MFAPLFDLSSFTLRKYKKGEVIKNEGDVCISIGLLLSGSISIINTNFENKEFLINSLHEGDMFGENLIFLTNNLFPGSIICDQNSTIAFINKSNFVKLLQEDIIYLKVYL